MQDQLANEWMLYSVDLHTRPSLLQDVTRDGDGDLLHPCNSLAYALISPGISSSGGLEDR